jgi:hypothetical protein
MLCFSGEGLLSIKTGDFPIHQQRMAGVVVGFKGSEIFALNYTTLTKARYLLGPILVPPLAHAPSTVVLTQHSAKHGAQTPTHIRPLRSSCPRCRLHPPLTPALPSLHLLPLPPCSPPQVNVPLTPIPSSLYRYIDRPLAPST